MPIRLFSIAIALVVTALLGQGLLGDSPSPARADCGHDNHPDLYGSGGISFGDGTAIRTGPHTDCTPVGRGYVNDRIDVHCVIHNSDGWHWLYVRDISRNRNGWSRWDAMRYSKSVYIPHCNDPSLLLYIPQGSIAGAEAVDRAR